MPKITKEKPTGPTKRSTLTSKYESAWDYTDKYKVCLYGDSGSGKTTFWCDWPKPILCLVCSGTKRSGELKSVPREYRSQIKALIVPNLIEALEILKEADNFETVVVDHISGLRDLAIRDIIGAEEVPVQRSFGMADKQQWGQSTLQSKEVASKAFDARGHTIIVAQQRVFGGFGSDEEEGSSVDDVIKPKAGADLGEAFANWLHSTADYVVQTYVRQKVIVNKRTIGEGKSKKVITTKEEVPGEYDFCLRTGKSDRYACKIRRPKGDVPPPLYIVDPTFKKFDQMAQGLPIDED